MEGLGRRDPAQGRQDRAGTHRAGGGAGVCRGGPRHAAHLFRALGEDGAEEADKAAADLRGRVAASFWVSTDAGRHLAIALDGNGAPVDGLGSNMGHVLGTGTLSAAESAVVAATVTGEELLDPFGIRTLGTGNGGFNPIGYHTGSIWTHDTAITLWGLARDGHAAEAARVARALLASAEAFDYRWPELYSGRPMMGRPAPYPASCRPQAWSAASAGVLVTVALGLRPNGAGGLVLDRCARRPSAPCAWRDCGSGVTPSAPPSTPKGGRP